MRQDERTAFDEALEPARRSAFPDGQFVGQESFMCLDEIQALAVAAGIGRSTSVLDLCCGVAGPGRWITRQFGCTYLGVDSSPSALEIARARAGDLPCRFQVATVPPLPQGQFDVVMLLETMLAFPDKEALLADVAGALTVGGRFAFTLEEGSALTDRERALMPDADTVWLTALDALHSLLGRAGLAVRWQVECTQAHAAAAEALLQAFTAAANEIAAGVGEQAVHELLVAHRLWSGWLCSGRVRKFAFVVERSPGEYC